MKICSNVARARGGPKHQHTDLPKARVLMQIRPRTKGVPGSTGNRVLAVEGPAK